MPFYFERTFEPGGRLTVAEQIFDLISWELENKEVEGQSLAKIIDRDAKKLPFSKACEFEWPFKIMIAHFDYLMMLSTHQQKEGQRAVTCKLGPNYFSYVKVSQERKGQTLTIIVKLQNRVFRTPEAFERFRTEGCAQDDCAALDQVVYDVPPPKSPPHDSLPCDGNLSAPIKPK